MGQLENTVAGRLNFDGALTLGSAADIRAKLQEMVAHHAIVKIDCDAVEAVDLSFIQLLLAAQSSAARANRTISLAHPASGALRDALRRGGFLTAPNQADRAFWFPTETV